MAELAPTDEVGQAHRDEVLAWIDRGDPLWRTARPATPPTHLVAYAVVVDPHERSILLVDHRLAGKWLPTGGHVEPGEQPTPQHRHAAEEMVEAFIYFRFPVVQAVSALIEEQGLATRRAIRLYAEINQFLDQVLVSTVHAHQAGIGAEPRTPKPTGQAGNGVSVLGL